MRIIVIVILVRSIFTQNFESAAICGLSLVLFLIPSFFETSLNIDIPPFFENIIYLFIFAAEILGEINNYYVLIPGWDTMLHTLNGFLCAAIGFSLVDIMNRKSENIELSPGYVALAAFCFSMTVGVIWEFIEFAADQFFFMDMQKDFIVTRFTSVKMDPNQINNITRTIIETTNGTYYLEGGYLDIGIIDTMKDLFVNFIGAVTFSTLGYFYVVHRDKNKRSIVTKFMITRTDQELSDTKEENDQ